MIEEENLCGRRDVHRRSSSYVPRLLQSEAAGSKETGEGERERVGVSQAPRPVSSPQASGPTSRLELCLVGAPARYGRQSMGLRGPTGAPHLDGGYADLDAADVPAEGAESVFSSGESGVHQTEEQQ